MKSHRTEKRVERPTAIETLGAAIEQALDEAAVSDVLCLLTGMFVGLTVELCRRQGHDANQEIRVDGGNQRDITIHTLKGQPSHAPEPLPPLPRITFAHEVDGPWRLELNGVAISQHETRKALEQAITDLRRAISIPHDLARTR